MKKTKLIYIIGSIIIGFLSVVGVFFGLIAGGVITTEQAKIVLATKSAEKEYDGTELTCDEWYIVDGALKEGHVARVIVSGTATEVGEYSNYFSVIVNDHVGADVTKDYVIEMQPGLLTVHKRTISMRSLSAYKVYDGKTLESAEVEILDDKLLDGHTIKTNTSESAVDIGIYNNIFTAQILDEQDIDVTHNYAIVYDYGTLEIEQRKLTISTEDLTKTYDGKPLNAGEWELSKNTPVVDGHILNVVPNSKQTNVGTTENEVLATVSDGENDVTHNYKIIYKNGTLEVTKCAITFITEGAEREYDGSPLTNEVGYVSEETPIAEGQEIRCDKFASITDVDEVLNEAELEIYDNEGKPATENYEISYDFGTLKVTPRPLTILTLGDEKEYDGTELTQSEWDYDGELVENQTLEVNIFGTITNAGDAENKASAAIYDNAGNPVTKNYEIRYEFGTLKVTPRPLMIKTDGASKVYDGTSFKYEEYTSDNNLVLGHKLELEFYSSLTNVGEADNRAAARVLAGTEDVSPNYKIEFEFGKLVITKRPLLIETYGFSKVYDGQALKHEEYKEVKDLPTGQVLEVHFKYSLTNVGEVNNEATVKVFAGKEETTPNYDISYQFGKLVITKRPILVETKGFSKTYDGQPLEWHEIEEVNDLVDGHYVEVTYQTSLTNVGRVNNEATVLVWVGEENNRENVTRNYDISYLYGTLEVTKRPITFTTDNLSETYNGNPHSLAEGSITEGDLVTNHKHVCTNNFTTITDVGVCENRVWIEILDENDNRVTRNYDISYQYGTLEVTKRPLLVETKGFSRTYDGQPLEWHEIEEVNGLVDGHYVEVTYKTSLTNVGEVNNEATARVWVGENENKKEVTRNYDISYLYGTLEVTKRPITFTTHNLSETYNGNPYSLAEGSITEGDLVTNHKYIYTNNFATITDAGVCENRVRIEILDENDNSVTRNYDISYQYGTLEVTKRPLLIQTKGFSRTYDGQPLEIHEIEDVNDLVDGHYVAMTYKTSLTNVGEAKNEATARVWVGEDENKKEVTRNYDITYQYGILEVTPLAITIKTWSDSKYYDGTPLKCEEYDPVENLPDGHELELTYTSITDVGQVKNDVGVIVKRNGTAINKNFIINVVCGTLTVHPRPITIETSSVSKVYDGTPLIAKDWEESTYDLGGTLVEGHELKVDFYCSVTNVDEPNNENKAIATIFVTIDGQQKDVSYNYDITYIFGTLTITPRPIEVQAVSDAKDYDGTVLRNPNYVEPDALIDGHNLTVVVDGEQLFPGSSENIVKYVYIIREVQNLGQVDVTGNYDIIRKPGVLTVRGDEDDTDQTPPSGDLKDSGNANDETVVLKVYSGREANLYLRNCSYGNYTGNSWTLPEAYSELLDNTYSYNYLFSILLEKANQQEHKVKIQSYTGYCLPYYMKMEQSFYKVQTSDVFYTGNTDAEYSLYYYDYNFANLGKDGLYGVNLGSYAKFAQEYEKNFVEKTYKDVPMDTKEFLLNIIKEQGFDASDEGIIAKVAKYIQKVAPYNLEYDKRLDDEEDIAVSFLSGKYDGGVCRHYATAATLLYRTLGIPARYVTGYSAPVKADAWTEVKAKQGHAWVEVYISGCGWVQVEVTGGGAGGVGGTDEEMSQADIMVRPATVTQKYDGLNSVKASNRLISNKGLTALVNKGYTYTVNVTGERTTPGKGKSVVQEFEIFNANQELVYKYLNGEELLNSEDFSIEFETGVLHLYYEKLTFTSKSYSKIYDGEILYPKNEYSWTGKLKEGHSLGGVVFTNWILKEGTIDNAFNVTIRDKNGKNVTDTYLIERKMGTLKVERRVIIITADSKSFTYTGSGEKFTCETYKVTSGQNQETPLAEGHSLSAKMTPESCISRRGEVANSVDMTTVVITDEAGEVVTNNYIVILVDGLLSMD